MRFFAKLLAAIWVLGVIVAPVEAKEPDMIAYYYPWYIKGDWSRHAYVGTPLLGKYGTDSPEVAKQQIRWCVDHAIDALFVSWWGVGHLTDRHMNHCLLKASNLNKIRFALFYESLGLLDKHDGQRDGVVDFSKPLVMYALISDIRHIAKKYFRHPQYYKISDRPVIGFYVTRTFRGFTQAHMDRLRQSIDVGIYAIADEAFFGEQATQKTSQNKGAVFDAYTAYNMFDDSRVQENDTALTYQQREALPIFREWSKHNVFIPGIFPGYADFRGHKTLPGNPADFAILLDAVASIGNLDKSSAPPAICLTSFNEWWEGTTIEPAKEYGSQYLNVVRQFKNRSD